MGEDFEYKLKLKVCLVGDSSVGKTSLIRRYVYDEYSDKYLTTIGTKVTKKELIVPNPDGKGNVHVNLAIWDIMGQHGFRALLQEAYFFGVDGTIAVCDMTREETMTGLKDWLDRTKEVAGSVPVVALGNKVDLEDELVVKMEDLGQKVEGYNAKYLLTSAKTGQNVEQAFMELTRRILEDRYEKKTDGSLSTPTQDILTEQAS